MLLGSPSAFFNVILFFSSSVKCEIFLYFLKIMRVMLIFLYMSGAN